MSTQDIVLKRSGGKCELCQTGGVAMTYEVGPQDSYNEDNTIALCERCNLQIEKKEELDNNRWSGLTTSMWSEVPGVQVMTWRMLNRLRSES